MQNARNTIMCCWRLWQYRIRRIVYSSSFKYISMPMKLDQKQEKKSGLICARLKPGSHQGFLQFRDHCYCKSLEIFMACIFFSISGGRLNIVKVLHKTQNIWDRLEAIWILRALTTPPSPSQNCRWWNFMAN